MKNKRYKGTLLTLFFITLISMTVYAGQTIYTIQKGDTLWRIAKNHKVGVSELVGANPQIKNPNLIYPDQKINIPTLDAETLKTEEDVLALVNAERKKAGVAPLTLDWEISRVASYKSKDMAVNNYFSHNSPTYGSPFDMLKSFKIPYGYAGENIAKGQKTPSAVMTAWMNSSGHRANILNPNFKKLGVGTYTKDGVIYWTQMFTD